MKSGTMDTAERTKKAGKPLFVIAFQEPGESAAGNAELIKQGAISIRTFGEIGRILEAIATHENPPAS